MIEYVRMQKSTMDSIAKAIQEREGSTDQIPGAEMAARILALGGGVEHTTGTVSFARGTEAKTFPHGLSKAPKLFMCLMDGYESALTIRIVALTYAEKLATLIKFVRTASSFSTQLESATVPGNSDTLPEYGAVSADEDNVYVSETKSQWETGDYTWEAWTW